MDKIVELCKKYDVPLIEDAAESLGTYYKGKHTGIFGDYGIFSFNGNKIITTSGGGMLVSDNEERISKARFWATQSRDQARHYQHSELGFNYRMSNVVAGIGRGQLKVLDQRVQKKRYIFDFYKRELENLEGIEFMPSNEWNEPNYWLSCMTLNGEIRPIDVMVALEKKILNLDQFGSQCTCSRSLGNMILLVQMYQRNFLRMVFVYQAIRR